MTNKTQGTTPESGNTFFGTPTITNNEAALLMHFVDNVFPLQYPMYKPEVSEGGRGWLLSLLLKTKPLYHASIGLSAYHRGVVLRELTSGGCTKPSIAEQESHLAICLTEFQEAIRSAHDCAKDCVYGRDICVGSSLAIMACVVQLVFFEVSRIFYIVYDFSKVLLSFRIAFWCTKKLMANSSPRGYRFVWSGVPSACRRAWLMGK